MLELFGTIGLLCLPPVDVRVERASCPDAAQLRDKLSEVGVLARLAGHVISLRAVDDRITVALTTATGDVVGERTIAGVPGCADRAAAASALVAAWAEVPAEARRDWPAARSPAASERVPPQTRFGLSTALSLALAPAEATAPGVGLSLLARRQRLGLRLGGFLTAPRRARLAEGSVRWQRLGGRVGVEAQLTRFDSPWRVSGGLEAVIGALQASGSGFPRNRAALGFSPGGGATLVVERAFGGWLRPFTSVGALWWPRAASFDRVGPRASRDVPGFDAEITVGLALLSGGAR